MWVGGLLRCSISKPEILPDCWTDTPYWGTGGDGKNVWWRCAFACNGTLATTVPLCLVPSCLEWQPAFQLRPLGVSLITESFRLAQTVHKINIANRKHQAKSDRYIAFGKRRLLRVYYYPLCCTKHHVSPSALTLQVNSHHVTMLVTLELSDIK